MHINENVIITRNLKKFATVSDFLIHINQKMNKLHERAQKIVVRECEFEIIIIIKKNPK